MFEGAWRDLEPEATYTKPINVIINSFLFSLYILLHYYLIYLSRLFCNKFCTLKKKNFFDFFNIIIFLLIFCRNVKQSFTPAILLLIHSLIPLFNPFSLKLPEWWVGFSPLSTPLEKCDECVLYGPTPGDMDHKNLHHREEAFLLITNNKKKQITG